MPINVAVVGSGPSAFYTVEALVKADADVRIDIIERLPTPFGLIRYGVAPDHQTTKNVQRNYTKTATNKAVAYFGNVEVGRDISLAELRQMYDAVVLAVGAPYDRVLGLKGEDKAGVYGSAAFVGWYNAHPDFVDLAPDLNTKNVVVIGNGNVAIDVARVLVKTREEMAKSDIVAYALDAVEAAPITDVYMVGRRGPIEAKFTNVELREMGELVEAAPVVEAAQLPDEVDDPDMSDRDKRLKTRNLGTLKSFLDQADSDKPKRVHFVFYAAPVEILGGEHVEAVRFEKTEVRDGRAVGTGTFFDVPCGMVVAAIGYQSSGLDDAPFDEYNGVFENIDGVIADGLYAVGWAKRGPTGVIGSNRPDGRLVAEKIIETFSTDSTKSGRDALQPYLDDKGIAIVTFADWGKIDAVEAASARPEAPREKLPTISEMMAVLGR